MNKKTIKITFGAMAIAFFTILIALDRQTGGMFSGSLLFLFPIPFMIYSNRFGFKNSIAIILASIIMAIFFGNFATNFIAISECIVGTIYGTMLYHKKNKWLSMGIVILISIFVTIASVTFLAGLLGTSMMAEIEEIQGIASGMGNLIPSYLYSTNVLQSIYIVSAVLVGILQGLMICLIGQLVNKKIQKILK